MQFCKSADREIKIATDNVLDLKMILAVGVVGLTVFEVGATAATPVWVTISLFGLNHFIEMQAIKDFDAARCRKNSTRSRRAGAFACFAK